VKIRENIEFHGWQKGQGDGCSNMYIMT
jgi:hypothetical protein